MFTNEKYLKFTSPSARRFFLRANDVISVRVTSATRVDIVYAQAEQQSQGWNIDTSTAAEANAAAADLMSQIIDLQAAPYTEIVRDFSANGYTITGQ